MIRSFELTILTELKLAHFSPAIWDLDEDPEFEFNDSFREKIIGIQEVFHTLLHTFPQIIIQCCNNFLIGNWNALSFVSFLFSGTFFVKIFYKIGRGFYYKGDRKKITGDFYMEI